MRPSLFRLLPLLVACACSNERSDGLLLAPPDDGPRIVFDLLARPLPEIPFPNDLATRLDVDAPTGRRVNASVSAPSLTEENVRREFNLLDGWGTFAPITVSFSEPIDPVDVRERHRNDDWADDAVFLVNLETGVPVRLDLGRGNFPVTIEVPGDYYPNDPRAKGSNLMFETYDEDVNRNGRLDEGEDTDGDGVLDKPNTADPTKPLKGVDPDDRAAPGEEGNDVYRDLLEFYERQTNTLLIRPVVPLAQQTTYAVVLTRGLRAPDGRAVRSPFDAVNHAAQTAQLQPLLAHLDAGRTPGLSRGNVAFAWAFTTQTVTRDLERIREGLYGEGPLAPLATDFPAVLEKVQAASIKEASEDEAPVHPLVTQEKADAESRGNRYVLRAETITNFINEFGGQIGVSLGDDMASLIDALTFVDYIVIGSYQSPDFMDDPRKPTTDAVWRVNPEQGAMQVWRRPDEWKKTLTDALDAQLALTRPNPPTADEVSELKRKARYAIRDRISFLLVVPKAHDGFKAPFPVTLHSHGANSAREEALAFGGHMAKFGVATIAINGFAHGLDIDPTLRALLIGFLEAEGLDPFAQAVFTGRARDLDEDGVEDSGGDFWVADTFHARDGVRQTVVDWMQLVRVLQRFGTYDMGDLNGDGKAEKAGDFNADGVIDVGGPAQLGGVDNRGHEIFMDGVSMGGIITGVTVAVEPEILAAAPISAGGGLGDIATRTDLGQVTNNVFPEVFGPLLHSEPVEGGVDLFTVVGGNTKIEYLKLNGPPVDVRPGDRVELVNLQPDNAEGARDAALVGPDRRFRLQVAGDNARSLDDSKYRPGPVRVGACDPARAALGGPPLRLAQYADCLVVKVSRRDLAGVWQPAGSFDRFGADVAWSGRVYPAGTPLVAIGRGFGFKRQSKTFRRFMTLAQTILDPADPANYARHYFQDLLPARAGKTAADRRPAAVLMIPSIGDLGVPINAGFAMARIAGVLPYEYDAAKPTPWGMSPNDVVISAYAMEGVEKLRRFSAVAKHMREPDAALTEEERRVVELIECRSPEICEKPVLADLFNASYDAGADTFLDEGARYMRGYGGAPRLKVPLTGEWTQATYPGHDAWKRDLQLKTGLVAVYPDAHGRHVFDFPNPNNPFDIGLYVINMVGAFFESRGTAIRTDLCLHRDGFDRPRKSPGARRVSGCEMIPEYPTTR